MDTSDKVVSLGMYRYKKYGIVQVAPGPDPEDVECGCSHGECPYCWAAWEKKDYLERGVRHCTCNSEGCGICAVYRRLDAKAAKQ